MGLIDWLFGRPKKTEGSSGGCPRCGGAMNFVMGGNMSVSQCTECGYRKTGPGLRDLMTNKK